MSRQRKLAFRSHCMLWNWRYLMTCVCIDNASSIMFWGLLVVFKQYGKHFCIYLSSVHNIKMYRCFFYVQTEPDASACFCDSLAHGHVFIFVFRACFLAYHPDIVYSWACVFFFLLRAFSFCWRTTIRFFKCSNECVASASWIRDKLTCTWRLYLDNAKQNLAVNIFGYVIVKASGTFHVCVHRYSWRWCGMDFCWLPSD